MVSKTNFTVIYIATIVLISFGILVGINIPYSGDVKWTDILSSFANVFMAGIAYMALNTWKSQLKLSKRTEQLEKLRMQLDDMVLSFQNKLLTKYCDEEEYSEESLIALFQEYRLNYENYQTSFGNTLPETLSMKDINSNFKKFEQDMHCAFLNQKKVFPRFFNGIIADIHKHRFKLHDSLKAEMRLLWK
ncbi:hypothetical protein QX223_21395 [Vibrio vulnificus]|uniref:hypothetical protein n=1 Tax=Vibrio vulnificus TaxID=672 RepID=UPI002878664A|nr:hypothetical protein [Vibrio vulnificus]MDS1828842.1 hypothetical protein [Vibrio vulnificus]